MMTTVEANTVHPATAFGWLAGATVLAAVLLSGVGYFPCLKLAGNCGIEAMFVGIAVSVVGTLLGLVVPVRHLNSDPFARHNALLSGMFIRLIATIIVGIVVAFGTTVETKALLIWIAIGYLTMLSVDTVGMVYFIKRIERNRQA